MRLWHYLLIPYLPKSQLLAQWRELNSIFKKQDRHILINYIYEYPKEDLFIYSIIVLKEMNKRGYKCKIENYQKYFFDDSTLNDYPNHNNRYENFIPFKNHHNNRYLKQCFYNLQEKFDRKQKDFSEETYNKLKEFVEKELNEKF